MAEQRSIERAFFRESNDGNTVFFPWGLTHRGYQLTDDTAKQKASRAAGFLIGAPMAIGVWIAHALVPVVESEGNGLSEIVDVLVVPGAVLMFVIVGYALWAWRFVERFPESDLRFSREERLREAAAHVKPRELVLIGIIVCGLSGLLVWLEPRTWWLGLLGVVLGVGLLHWSSLIKRAAADASN